MHTPGREFARRRPSVGTGCKYSSIQKLGIELILIAEYLSIHSGVTKHLQIYSRISGIPTWPPPGNGTTIT